MSKTSIEWLPGRRLSDCRTSGATMGTRYSARFLAPEGADVAGIAAALAAAVAAVDQQMSNWKADSDLSRLNRAPAGAWTPVPPALAQVLARALQVGRETGDAFDIGVGDLVDAWGFGPSGARRPAAAAAAPRAPAHALLEIDRAGARARKHGPVALDLCGIAKGFGVDELARVLDARGVDSWLVGIDGELRARGARPDGAAWAIALEAPDDDRRSAMGVIELADGAVATSGDYRHWVLLDGERVSHTMDPRTGAPLRHALASVTVVAACCTDADAYATALMVLGPHEGPTRARSLGLDALFVARDGQGFRSAGTGAFSDPTDVRGMP
jgi:thiamine biosynthesis lipoprotein